MLYEIKDTRGCRNNNPFNIVISSSRWKGKLDKSIDPKFEQFVSMEYGVRAGIVLLRNYIRNKSLVYGKRDTILKIVNSYAPVTENRVMPYARYLSYRVFGDESKIREVIKYPSLQFANLCTAIMWYESLYEVPVDYIYTLINQFKLY